MVSWSSTPHHLSRAQQVPEIRNKHEREVDTTHPKSRQYKTLFLPPEAPFMYPNLFWTLRQTTRMYLPTNGSLWRNFQGIGFSQPFSLPCASLQGAALPGATLGTALQSCSPSICVRRNGARPSFPRWASTPDPRTAWEELCSPLHPVTICERQVTPKINQQQMHCQSASPPAQTGEKALVRDPSEGHFSVVPSPGGRPRSRVQPACSEQVLTCSVTACGAGADRRPSAVGPAGALCSPRQLPTLWRAGPQCPAWPGAL